MLTLALLSAALGALPAQRAVVRHERMPILPGRADARLWRDASYESTVFGRKPEPVFVLPDAASARALLALGVFVRAGEWQLVHLDATSLRSALASSGALRLERPPALRPSLDVSGTEVGAARARAGEGLAEAYRGRGVLVGIVDTGVDLTHPAFRDAAGHSRVLAVWDQDAATGPAPAAFGYGRECTSAVLARDECDIGDSAGHGTHVAGIAAGNAALGGIADEATIAVVRSDSFTRLADAVSYLVELAHRRAMPLVINMSVGGQYGPHDGRTPLEQFLDKTSGPGRVLVAAAGNDGNDRLHLTTRLSGSPVRSAIERLPRGRSVDTIIEVWSLPTDDVQLSAELWCDGTLAGEVALSADQSELVSASLGFAEAAFEVTCDSSWEASHMLAKRTVVVDGSRAGELPESCELALAMRGDGVVHAWLSQSDYRFGVARFSAARGDGWVAGDGQLSIAVPASARSVVAVGAYATRVAWASEVAGPQQLSSMIFGALAPYSSVGPSTAPSFTGQKPDVAAPGSVILSARAAVVPSGPNTVDDARVAMQGTSMAAPHVTGVVALMLQANPELTPAMVRSVLRHTARADSVTGPAPNDQWGAGKLDALAATQRTEAEAGGCAAAERSSLAAFAAVVFGALLARRRSGGAGGRPPALRL